MLDDHWFDMLNKLLVRENPRRSLLAATGLLASLGIGGPFRAVAKQGNGKGKGKHKGKGKGKEKDKKDKGQPQPCGPDIHDACESFFSLAHHTPQDVQSCKDRCAQCNAEGTAFCIIEREERATCCAAGEVCCGDGIFGDCCLSDRCCTREGGDTSFCAQPGKYCCRDGTGGSCRHGEACCANGTCLACEAPAVPNPATCQCEPCPGDQIPNPCPGLPGVCVDGFNRVCCVGFSCVFSGDHPDNYDCCGVAPDDNPNTTCRRFDQRCAPDKRYPPLATYCSPNDPVCLEPPFGG